MTSSGIFITNIENDTVNNKYYRQVLYTTKNQQLVIQSVAPKQDINFEIHNSNDQFVRIEKGQGLLVTGPNREFKHELMDGIAFIIPAGTYHQIINTSDKEDLKLYTIYSPRHLPNNLVEKTKPTPLIQSAGRSNARSKGHLF